MQKSLSFVFVAWICAAAFPILARGIPGFSTSSHGRTKSADFQLITISPDSDLVSVVRGILRPFSQNGTLTEEGIIKLKNAIGHYRRQRGENFTEDGVALDGEAGRKTLSDFLEKLGSSNGDFNYTIVRSIKDEIDVEEEEEETVDPKAKDEVIVDYIKNIDRMIAVEDGNSGREPNDKELEKLFRIMS